MAFPSFRFGLNKTVLSFFLFPDFERTAIPLQQPSHARRKNEDMLIFADYIVYNILGDFTHQKENCQDSIRSCVLPCSNGRDAMHPA